MPTVGSITKTIRINPKDLEIIERLMEDGTSWSGAIHKLCEGYRGDRIEEICRTKGLDREKVVEKILQIIERMA